jgi:hypothetical protein
MNFFYLILTFILFSFLVPEFKKPIGIMNQRAFMYKPTNPYTIELMCTYYLPLNIVNNTQQYNPANSVQKVHRVGQGLHFNHNNYRTGPVVLLSD